MNEDALYAIALTKLPKIGAYTAKKLSDYFGHPKLVFELKAKELESAPGVGIVLSRLILQHKSEALEMAESELVFAQEKNIRVLTQSDDEYPFRLKECPDAPLVLYSKGNTNYNNPKVVSVVGTRASTHYGKEACEALIDGLKAHNPLVVSGLAYGIDATAHEQALVCGLQTVGVLAHGLNNIYPVRNRKLANLMYDNGGVVTEFTSEVYPEKEHFPKRNRIVAGLSDVTIVVESALKGGSLITARIAQEYNREVAAFPGNIDQPCSMGCNEMIRTQRAALIKSAQDLEELMGWGAPPARLTFETMNLSDSQMKIVEAMKGREKTHIDDLAKLTGLLVSDLSAELLELEFRGVVGSLPGNLFLLA